MRTTVGPQMKSNSMTYDVTQPTASACWDVKTTAAILRFLAWEVGFFGLSSTVKRSRNQRLELQKRGSVKATDHTFPGEMGQAATFHLWK